MSASFKILIGYPPTPSKKGIALLSQNRQFQWFSNPTRIYPVILAGAATLARDLGHEVRWMDAIAEGISPSRFFRELESFAPDLFVFETKTPVIRQHWALVDEIKERFPAVRVAMLGDHVTALPEETFRESKADYVLRGGHYDAALENLLRFLEAGEAGVPPDGVWKRGSVCGVLGNDVLPRKPLDDLPWPDRDLTKWKLYQKEYNLVGNPFQYIMSGRDCWHGKCTFCAWTTLFPHFSVRSPENVLDEVEMLVSRYGVKEIFDDSGTLSVGPWLERLCDGLVARGLDKKIRYSCNMRFGALGPDQFKMMKRAGFRLLKFGLESANQATLDRICKKTRVEDIERDCRAAKAAGLTVHLTMIVGYPWETEEDALRTLALAERLMKRGWADLLQATTVVPYPGTPLYREALANDGFLFSPTAYERFDMSEPVLKSPIPPERIREICAKIYDIFLSPAYVFQRLKAVRRPKDLAFLARGAGAVFGHLRDFGKARKRIAAEGEGK